MNPKITDYGLVSLKENASIFLKYKNKNSYSSPEVLASNKTIDIGTNPKADVYSFGILLWEIYTSMMPFDVPIKKVVELVVQDDFRPEITKEFNKDIAELIRICWESNPQLRPDFKTIIKRLNNVNIEINM